MAPSGSMRTTPTSRPASFYLNGRMVHIVTEAATDAHA
jgi:hypothetical protein